MRTIPLRMWAKKTWGIAQAASTATWLWSVVGGFIIAAASFASGLDVGWVITLGVAVMLAVVATVATLRERRSSRPSIDPPDAMGLVQEAFGIAVRGPTPFRRFQPRSTDSLGPVYLRTDVKFTMINNQTAREWSLMVSLIGWIGDQQVELGYEEWMDVYHTFPATREGFLANPRKVAPMSQVIRPMPFLVGFDEEWVGRRLAKPRLVITDLNSSERSQRVIQLPETEAEQVSLRWADPPSNAVKRERTPTMLASSEFDALATMARAAKAMSALQLRDRLITEMRRGEELIDIGGSLMDVASGYANPEIREWYRTVYYLLLPEWPNAAQRLGNPANSEPSIDGIRRRLRVLEQIIAELTAEGETPIL